MTSHLPQRGFYPPTPVAPPLQRDKPMLIRIQKKIEKLDEKQELTKFRKT